MRIAFRSLAKNPGFALAAIVTLALGVGANTAIFTIVNAVLIRPLPLPHPQRVIFFQEGTKQSPWDSTSLLDFRDYRKQSGVFEQIEAAASVNLNLKGRERPERVLAATVTPGYLAMMGAQPLTGRTFLADEDQPGRNRVIVLGEGLWRADFGADSNVVGKTIEVNGEKYTVAGVMPTNFRFPFTQAEAWIPLTPEAAQLDRANRSVELTGRLKPGSTLPQAQAEMNTIFARLAAQYPDTNSGRRVALRTLQEQRVRNVRVEFTILLGAVLFVFLIGCANVANLLLARAASRVKEYAIRRALGAGRWRLLRQFVAEASILAVGGAIVGSMLALWFVDLVISLPGMPVIDDVTPDATVLLFTIGLSFAAVLAMSLAGSLQTWRLELIQSLKEGGRGSSVSATARMRRFLVVGEIAAAMVLLVGAGLLMRSFLNLHNTNPGFDPKRVLTMRTSLPAGSFDDVLQKISTLPGVKSAAVSSSLPLEGYGWYTGFDIEGQPGRRKEEQPVVLARAVSSGYFHTLAIPILSGRAFSDADDSTHPPSAIVNEKLARNFFPNGNAIGQRIRVKDSGWMSIVGTSGDVKESGLGRETEPEIEIPYKQMPPAPSIAIAIRTTGDPAAMAGAVRKQIASLHPDQPVFALRSMEQLVAESMAGDRGGAQIMGAFAALAALLAAVGIYGVISYLAKQRRQEMGIRIALGAGTGDIVRIVVLQGLKLAGAGIAIGLLGAFAVTRVMAGHIYASVTDPVAFTVVPVFLAIVAVLATVTPALAASRVDPIEALRYE
jgi:putative ABC transport system permease protein